MSFQAAPGMNELCINTIRTLSMDAIQKANSGHPGAPMGLAPAGYILWSKIMKHNPKNPAWLDRDRFVLSGGHASMLLYSLLHLCGYAVSIDDIKNFRQIGSKTPGHPEFGHTSGVETTTGPLGQGVANAVGFAMAEAHLASVYNKPGFEIINHNTYVMCGDGDMMEGISSEAASLAGHLGLGKLVCIYDDNKISIEGPTSITFTENVEARYAAYGWQVIKVEDGNTDFKGIYEAIEAAKAEKGKPTLIILRTHIAYGSPNKQNSEEAHGAPLGAEEIVLTKKNLGWNYEEPFLVPEEARVSYKADMEKGEKSEEEWTDLFREYSIKYPELANQLLDGVTRFVEDSWESCLPVFRPEDKPLATRSASGKVINAIAEKFPCLIGGSADLAPSNNTYLKCSHEFQKGSYDGRNIRFGVREHAMGAIINGMILHGGVRPFAGTFLVFSDYMRPSMRVASLMKLPLIYVFTHDSIAVGEDGPTHQPVEHVASLRAIPNLTVIRPADANETAEAWRYAIKSNSSPVALVLSRQNLPILERKSSPEGVASGAYILKNTEGKPDIILMASGSEVSLIVEAEKILSEKGIKARTVSMPSWEIYEKTADYYKEWVLTSDAECRLAVEAGISMGWDKYTGPKGAIMSIDTFGESGPGSKVMEKFGFTAEKVAEKALEVIKKNSGQE